MSFINENTVSPVDATYIGFINQTAPFGSNNYQSGTPYFLYDTYVIPKGVWLISVSSNFEKISVDGAINFVNTAIALPNNVPGKNPNGFVNSSGLTSYTCSVSEPYYSDGSKSCGIFFYVTTTDNSDFWYGILLGNMTYVKIA